MSDFWKTATCSHKQTSPPDEMGQAICGDCGARVTVKLTEALFFDQIDAVMRDHGSYGRHSKRCVRLEGGDYVCADDCQMGRRR